MRLTLLLAAMLLYACDGEPGKDTGQADDTDGGDLVDADADGYLDRVDCDETNPAIHPGADETCDGVDEDCDGTADDGVGTPWYTDADGDGYGDGATLQVACDAPAGTVEDGSDCDDSDPAYNPGATEGDCADPADYNCDGSVGYADADGDGFPACQECDDGDAAANPAAAEACNGVDDDCDAAIDEDVGTLFYADADGDGYGAPGTSLVACAPPEGYVADGTDCDDTQAAFNPGAAEDCSDPTDYNCDGSVGFADADGDGFSACTECDDTNGGVNPGVAETCNGIDDDCDGATDEDDAADAPTWYLDADEDGHGRATRSAVTCDAPEGYVASGDDCDDLDPTVSPSGTETCDGEDEDCDGAVDEGATDPSTWYADADGDGFGDTSVTASACDAPEGYVANGDDCDDGDLLANPGADEVCGGGDENCDGTVDEDAADPRLWYVDADGDGTGNLAYHVLECDAPAGYAGNGWDCDDTDAAVNPYALESCNGVDDDCDTDVDEAGALGELEWYADTDGDGFGDPVVPTLACDRPAGFLADASDCDDGRADVNPGAAEVCDAADVDEDCDGGADESGSLGESTWYADADGDTYGAPGSDRLACNQPAAFVADDSDCDDTRPSVNPSMSERCDADDLDEDCNGVADDDDAAAAGLGTFYADADADGYGIATATIDACELPDGYAPLDGDCDDADDAAYPTAPELCDLADNDCNGATDEGIATTAYFPDEDGDGFGDPDGDALDSCMAPVGYRLDATDCDDGDITVHPYAWEDGTNGIDDDCDGLADTADTTTVTAGPQSDDSSTSVSLGISFPFCGTDRTTAYMISNGRVTFGASDTDLSEATTDFDDDTAIAAMWDDFNPASTYGGDTWYIQYADAVGFHWRDVREYGLSTTNNFSAVLFDDGRILLQYATLAATDGLIGFSCAPGTVASEVDLSAEMAGIEPGRWGIGDPTSDRMYYEIFSGADNDADDTVLRLCGNPDSATDNCAE